MQPTQLFFATHQQRVDLARQQFFDEGKRPTGLVGEAVIQSWGRCAGSRRHPGEGLMLEPVTTSRVHATLGRNRQLLVAASAELAELEIALAGTACRTLLMDATGLIVHVSRSPQRAAEQLMPTVCRIGVNLAEGVVGTNAPGIVAKTGQACSVQGSEHYFHGAQALHCVAAPIRDASGALTAVLDLSIESRAFGFDAMSLVTQYATAIENRLLLARAEDQLVLHLHTNRSLLGTPFEALAGITQDGHVAWLNELATRMVGGTGHDVESRFGLSPAQVESLLAQADAALVRLPSGLAVWAKASLNTPGHQSGRRWVALGSASTPDTPSAPPPSTTATTADPALQTPTQATLDDLGRQHIERTLAACSGNVSQAARTLGVSRGLIYRHLRAAPTVPS